MDNERITALGYEFASLDDAILAQAEKKKIDFIKENLDSGDAETVKALYDKAIEGEYFKTPVGIGFLSEMREYLIDTLDYTEDEVRAIPLKVHYENKKSSSAASARPKKERVGALFISIVLNIALFIGVIIMFWIALSSEQPNILNYETAITNRYAAWEQDLTERERAVKEAERNLELDRSAQDE